MITCNTGSVCSAAAGAVAADLSPPCGETEAEAAHSPTSSQSSVHFQITELFFKGPVCNTSGSLGCLGNEASAEVLKTNSSNVLVESQSP